MNSSSKAKLKDLLGAILVEHSAINHNYEVSWALWICKSFEIEIDEDCANRVIETGDSVAILILLDLINTTTLVSGSPDVPSIEADLEGAVLYSEKWLLAYEGVKKGWLKPKNPTLLQDDHFFTLLKHYDVEFYDTARQLHTYPLTKPTGPPVSTISGQEALYEALQIEMLSHPSNFIPDGS
jgi:hypothetical protein